MDYKDNRDSLDTKNSLADKEVDEVRDVEVDTETDVETEDIPLVKLSLEEKICCLKEIESKFKKVLYVYDESQKPNSSYNYKVYTGGVLIYVSSSNMLFNGELIGLIINLNAILNNNLSKTQIKRIVFESRNQIQYLTTTYKKELNRKKSKKSTNSENSDDRDIRTVEDL